MLQPIDQPIFHQHRYAQELDRLVVPGCAWLDIGAGHRIHDGWAGPTCDDLAKRPAYFAGCDVGDDVLSHPHLHEKRIADASNLPWPDESFDLVTANMVIEHLATPRDVFSEACRVLKPGGAFLVLTPNRDHPIIKLAALLLPTGLRRLYAVLVERRDAAEVFPTTYRCNTVLDLSDVAAQAGFVPELVEAFVNAFPILPGALGTAETYLVQKISAASTTPRGADIIAVFRKPK